MFATKLRAAVKSGVTSAIVLINHPMRSGLLHVDGWGRRSPCQFITEIVAEHNGQKVLTTHWSGYVSQNPAMEFRFKGGQKGDTLTLRWIDNAGNQGRASTLIS
jgi:sulfur-oxidizing protein SoxZ